jgi:DNA-binding MarR family transcriptional regulator
MAKRPITAWSDPTLEPNPGEPEDGRGLRYLVRAVNRVYTKLIETSLGPHLDITYPQWSFIRVLSQQDGLSQRELAERVGLMENTTLVALNVMERRGWVRRERDRTDRRRLLVYLTAEGRAVERLRPLVRDANLAAIQGLDQATVDALRRGLKAMLANLDEALEASTKPKRRSGRKAARAAERPRVGA